MGGIEEVREEYKQALRQLFRHADCLGVDSDERREAYNACEEEVKVKRALRCQK